MLTRSAGILTRPAQASWTAKRALTVVSWTDMGRSKHDFVHFIKEAVANNSSAQAKELHEYLVKCFIDADTDYDGLVTFQGFNKMIAEAASVPRRFGFAPHTRELYGTKEEFDAARQSLYKQLSGPKGKVTLENWVGWAKPHIVEKAKDLEDHRYARWERNYAGFVSFFQGVAKAGSAHNKKTSESTQLKEFYVLTSRQFLENDVHNQGWLGKPEFNALLRQHDALKRRFGQSWYDGVTFEKIAVGGKVTWHRWFVYHMNLVTEKSGAL